MLQFRDGGEIKDSVLVSVLHVVVAMEHVSIKTLQNTSVVRNIQQLL